MPIFDGLLSVGRRDMLAEAEPVFQPIEKGAQNGGRERPGAPAVLSSRLRLRSFPLWPEGKSLRASVSVSGTGRSRSLRRSSHWPSNQASMTAGGIPTSVSAAPLRSTISDERTPMSASPFSGSVKPSWPVQSPLIRSSRASSLSDIGAFASKASPSSPRSWGASRSSTQFMPVWAGAGTDAPATCRPANTSNWNNDTLCPLRKSDYPQPPSSGKAKSH